MLPVHLVLLGCFQDEQLSGQGIACMLCPEHQHLQSCEPCWGQFRRVWPSLTYPYLTSSSSRFQQLSSVCHSISLRKQHWIWAESGKDTFVLFVLSIHEDSPLLGQALSVITPNIHTCWGMAGHDPAFYPQSPIFHQSLLLKKIWLPPHSPLNICIDPLVPTFNYQGAWSSIDKHRFASYGIIPHAQLPMWQEQDDWNESESCAYSI